MSTKLKIILIILILSIGGALGYLYFTRTTTQNSDGTTTTTYKNFNPFGTSGTLENTDSSINQENGNTENQEQGSVDVVTSSKFQKITETSVAGASFFEIKNTEETTQNPTDPNLEIISTIPVVSYVEKVTGHIYQYNLKTKTPKRVSNTTIPTIHEAFFNTDSSKAIYRYESDNKINTYLVTIGKELGDFIPTNITNLSVSKNKDSFFYLIKTKNGSTGYVQYFDNTKPKVVLESSFSEWMPQFISNQTIYLTTKASGSREGYLYSLNTSTGTITKLFGNIIGLTTLANNDGSLVLASSSKDSGPELQILDVKKHSTTTISLAGLPEKCIWSNDEVHIYCAIPKNIPSGEYPDSWYQGLVSFDDKFVKINTTNSEITSLYDGQAKEPLDATGLFFDSKEENLFFINKIDSKLWSLNLK